MLFYEVLLSEHIWFVVLTVCGKCQSSGYSIYTENLHTVHTWILYTAEIVGGANYRVKMYQCSERQVILKGGQCRSISNPVAVKAVCLELAAEKLRVSCSPREAGSHLKGSLLDKVYDLSSHWARYKTTLSKCPVPVSTGGVFFHTSTHKSTIPAGAKVFLQTCLSWA